MIDGTKSLLVAFNKPYGVISQFTPHSTYRTLAEFHFPKNLYSIGRLDAESEGLLLLGNDGDLAHRLLDPRFGHARTYWVQVEGKPSRAGLTRLERGIILDGVATRRASAGLIAPPEYPDREKPIRFRKHIPTSWIELTLTEGRNRQVRRMTAAIGHPTLRLIRSRILTIEVGSLSVGQWRELGRREMAALKAAVQLTGPEEYR